MQILGNKQVFVDFNNRIYFLPSTYLKWIEVCISCFVCFGFFKPWASGIVFEFIMLPVYVFTVYVFLVSFSSFLNCLNCLNAYFLKDAWEVHA